MRVSFCQFADAFPPNILQLLKSRVMYYGKVLEKFPENSDIVEFPTCAHIGNSRQNRLLKFRYTPLGYVPV